MLRKDKTREGLKKFLLQRVKQLCLGFGLVCGSIDPSTNRGVRVTDMPVRAKGLEGYSGLVGKFWPLTGQSFQRRTLKSLYSLALLGQPCSILFFRPAGCLKDVRSYG